MAATFSPMTGISSILWCSNMTSILTNAGAASALQTLRSISSNMETTQGRVSTGLRVRNSSDNAAYWSIATTMRSDNKANAAVSDTLGLGAAKIDTAYSGISSAIDVMNEFKAKLVAASEPGVDKQKVQKELDQFKDQLLSISASASFSGENWLKTDIADIYDAALNTKSLVSSFVRGSDGRISLGTTDIDLSTVSLFNATGGGILQKDNRSPGTIGRLRNTDTFTYGGGALQSFTFDGPLVFTDDSTAITFDMVLDADDPSNTTAPGSGSFVSVTLNRSLMDQVYPTLNGVIWSRDQFAWLMREAIIPLGAQFATRAGTVDGYALLSKETSGLTGSSIQVLNVSSTLADGKTGGLSDTGTDYGSRPVVVSYWDEPFNVHSTIELLIPVKANGSTTVLKIDQAMVNQTLGTTTGDVTSADDLVLLLNTALQAQNVGIIATNAGGYIRYEMDETIEKASGSKTSLGIGPASDSLGNLPDFDILDVDITTGTRSIDSYIDGIEGMLSKLTNAGATLGSLQTRIDMQAEFVTTLTYTIDKGIGRLVDADMNEESTRLKALETQQQLGIQALHIANSNSENVMALFR